MQSLNVTSEPIYRSVSRNQGRAVFYLPSTLLLCAVSICKLCLHCHDVCNVAPCKCISVNCVEILLNVKSSSAAGRTGNGLPTPSLRMDTPISGVSLHPFIMSKRLKRAHPFSVMEWVSHSQCVLQLMMTYYIKTSEMGVSILSNGVGKPFSVRPTADDDLLCQSV